MSKKRRIQPQNTQLQQIKIDKKRQSFLTYFKNQ